jgi:hypothetical protein
MKIAKIVDRKKERFVEVVKVGGVKFDPRPGWVFIKTIEKTNKECEWVHPDEVRFEWIREFA